MTYDLIIIGMGISGISAAIYAKRSNLNVLIIDKSMPGGLLNNIDEIDNYPGFSKISGPDFAMNLLNQLENLEVSKKIEEVIDVINGDIHKVVTNKDTYYAKNVLISCGRNQRTLGLVNEKELLGHGVSTCALCDGMFYKDKEVAVVGGGNSALSEALYLSKIVKKIYLIHRRDTFTAGEEVKEKIKKSENIEIIYKDYVKELLSDNGYLDGIVLASGKKLDVSGLFVYIGFSPKAEFIKKLDITDDNGYILVDDKMETKIKGIYASGDIVKKEIYQLITAASEGATAAVSIINSLK